jgi:hypothetical protein
MAAYSFQDIGCTIIGPGGVVTLGAGSGAAEEGISTEMEGDKNTMTKGADDSTMHSLHASTAGTCTVRLLKTSPANAQLQLMYDLQAASSALWGQNTIVIRDAARGDLESCRQTAFKKRTGLTWAKDGGMNEWQFDVGKLNTVLGLGSL